MAYPFAAAEVLTAVDLNAMIGAPTQNAQTGTTYTAVLLDAGKTVTLSNASAVTLTIPAQASVSWADNTQLNFLNLGAGTVTITPAADVTINGTPLTLATSKGGSLVRTASNTWTFIPFSAGGVDNANFTNTATGTYTDGGIDYKYITFTGSGPLVVDQAGFADCLLVGPGGGGSAAASSRDGGGAGGGQVIAENMYLTAATHTVTIGAGGAGGDASGGDEWAYGGRSGGVVSIGDIFFSSGGGGGGPNGRPGLQGSSGGGGGDNYGVGASAFASITGFAGSNGGVSGTAGAGGGAGGAGSGVTGGVGVSSSLNDTPTVYGAGGDATTGTPAAGAANSGNGGEGGGDVDGGAGGSGVIIIRVAV